MQIKSEMDVSSKKSSDNIHIHNPQNVYFIYGNSPTISSSPPATVDREERLMNLAGHVDAIIEKFEKIVSDKKKEEENKKSYLFGQSSFKKATSPFKNVASKSAIFNDNEPKFGGSDNEMGFKFVKKPTKKSPLLSLKDEGFKMFAENNRYIDSEHTMIKEASNENNLTFSITDVEEN